MGFEWRECTYKGGMRDHGVQGESQEGQCLGLSPGDRMEEMCKE